ncbi:methyltransferase domain-containing protein [Sinosporangium siamense]|uniref:Protein-L-isoaspartate O-methyltransferase n=1 Tax=Sinosporangium siamense TaxID=1367973 RepID=A0A919RNU3_9ACTN|nr:methyltransferase domain-containing protein [Sinosporangium siamense]GII97123.1 protein-L-isoaspartate O-methyltransferase [Sinosporangium siamense]
MTTTWRDLARELADALSAAGALPPAWRQAFVTVPRHVFIPSFYLRPGDEGDDPRRGRHFTPGVPDYLPTVYSDDTLVTQHIECGGWPWATSSSTRPSLMLRILDELDVVDGVSVLEIGTGTGYNAALLSERLGDHLVTSVDIDPDLVELAGLRLKELGYRPALAVRDGREGHPRRAPYDRLVATVAFEQIPGQWVRQVRIGGVIVADLRPAGASFAGALTRLTVTGEGVASGPLLACPFGFMPARSEASLPGVPTGAAMDRSDVRRRESALPGEALLVPGLALVTWQRLPGLVVYPGAESVTLVADDSSWAEMPLKKATEVTLGGPRDVWAIVEDAHTWWESHGRPDVGEFGLSVTPERQWLWLETPDIPLITPR